MFPDLAPPSAQSTARPFPKSTARIAGHPIHPMLVPFPIVCFVGTLFTDIAYVASADGQWANFSSWLLTMGLFAAIFVAISGVTDFIGDRRIRALGHAWIHGVGNSIVLVLAIWNAFVHTQDGYSAVWPTGLTLSIVVVILLLVTGWNGWSMVYRHGVGVHPTRPL